MAKKADDAPSTARLNIIMTNDTAADIKTALATLQRHGVYCSMSLFFEIAATEFLKRPDLVKVMREHKPKARRDKPKSGRG